MSQANTPAPPLLQALAGIKEKEAENVLLQNLKENPPEALAHPSFKKTSRATKFLAKRFWRIAQEKPTRENLHKIEVNLCKSKQGKNGTPFTSAELQPELATWLLGVNAEESEESDGDQSGQSVAIKPEYI